MAKIKSADYDRIFSIMTMLQRAWAKTPELSFADFLNDIGWIPGMDDDTLRQLLRNRVQDTQARLPKTGRPGC